MDVATDSKLELSPAAIRDVEERVNANASGNRRLALLALAGVGVMIAAGWTIGGGLVWLTQLIGFSKPVGLTIAGVVTSACMALAWMLIFPRIMRRSIRVALRECGYDICIACGYRLDGLKPGARCPECGRAVQPPLGERRPGPTEA